MPLTCVKCSRVNPPDAVYCYHDGFALNGHGGRGAGPVAIGAQQFPSPFVFASGRTCRNFDELAIGCQEDWEGARELLQQGFFGAFFGGMGRADLARAAAEAKKFGDPDRGLDQLLDKLPTEVLQDPKLRVDPLEINLGTLQVGEDRELEVHLDNQGMRLLCGKLMAVDSPWLTIGEGQGVSEKIFQFTHETRLKVHLKGNKLRAGSKPIEGKLLVDSNGGEPITIVVRCDVPVKPYPGTGPLAGARSPRQVAEKAKANPKGAAVLFEKGEVAEWYASNGWTYPVQGPSASGIGAVQQFFEALGLTPPPKVDISHRSVALSGTVGQQNLRHVLQISTPEKRPVYAHGSSNQPWLEVGRARLNGRTADIPLIVPTIPDRPGETLTAKVTVQANGNQKFVVPVTLQIGENLDFTAPEPVLAPIPLEQPKAVPTMPVVTLPMAEPEPLEMPALTPSSPRRRQQGIGAHWLAAAGLGAALVLLILMDLLRKDEDGGGPDEPKIPKGSWVKTVEGSKPSLGVGFTDDRRWGLTALDQKDPNNDKKSKRLTFDENGGTNNTVIMIDRYEYVFGRRYHKATIGKNKEIIKNKYWACPIRYGEHGVTVTQHVMLVPGSSGNLDNCLVYYTIKNESNAQRTVAARVLIDTFIGSNDGVPFTIPGEKKLMTTQIDLPYKAIPDYIEAVENGDDAKNPGTVARFGLKGVKIPDADIDPPTRLVICQQPENPQVKWDWGDFQPIKTELKSDSCVVLYWDEVKMNRDEVRTVGFTYGLNSLEVTGGERGGTGLALSGPAGVVKGREFTVSAYVYNATAGQQVTIDLPPELELASGEKSTKAVDSAGARVPVHWKVKGKDLGQFQIKAKTGSTQAKPIKVRVRDDSIFG